MKIIRFQVYLYFWTAAILIAFLGMFLFLTGNDGTIFLNIGDTYIVIAFTTLTTFFAPLFLIQGFCYWLLLKYKKTPSISLTQSHTLLSIGSFIGFILLLIMINIMHNPNNVLRSSDAVKTQTIGLLTVFFALSLAQPIFLVNMAIGLKRK